MLIWRKKTPLLVMTYVTVSNTKYAKICHCIHSVSTVDSDYLIHGTQNMSLYLIPGPEKIQWHPTWQSTHCALVHILAFKSTKLWFSQFLELIWYFQMVPGESWCPWPTEVDPLFNICHDWIAVQRIKDTPLLLRKIMLPRASLIQTLTNYTEYNWVTDWLTLSIKQNRKLDIRLSY